MRPTAYLAKSSLVESEPQSPADEFGSSRFTFGPRLDPQHRVRIVELPSHRSESVLRGRGARNDGLGEVLLQVQRHVGGQNDWAGSWLSAIGGDQREAQQAESGRGSPN